jgi:hypothetical protein
MTIASVTNALVESPSNVAAASHLLQQLAIGNPTDAARGGPARPDRSPAAPARRQGLPA